jgi:cytochrome oxidase Cu insertion factor (SCO1/SenC/PrrC family)
MGTGQKILTATLWALLIAVMAGVVGVGVWQHVRGAPQSSLQPGAEAPGTSSPDQNLAVLWDAPDFSLVNQDAQPVTKKDLLGHPWVASFIFTNCAGPCPMISSKMATLQKSILDPAIKLVSFTVDPKRDTPEVLKKYASNFNADATRWSFLTGTPEQIQDVTVKMKIARQEDGSPQIEHGTQFLLIDKQGRVRGIYRGQSTDPQELQRLATDAAKLAGEKSQ